MPSIPVIATGAREEMGQLALEQLKPEIEVVHYVLLPAIEHELPCLLTGQVPSSASSSIGSGDWSRRPQAVLFGGGYTADDLIALRQLVAGVPEARQIPWLHLDMDRATIHTPGTPEYAAEIAARAKDALARLEREGKLGDGYGELVPA